MKKEEIQRLDKHIREIKKENREYVLMSVENKSGKFYRDTNFKSLYREIGILQTNLWEKMSFIRGSVDRINSEKMVEQITQNFLTIISDPRIQKFLRDESTTIAKIKSK